MWEFIFLVKNALSSTCNSYMSADTRIALAFASVYLAEPLGQKKVLRSYPEVVNYLLEKFASEQAIAQ